MTQKVCNNAICTVFLDSAIPINIIKDAKAPDKKWEFIEAPLMRANFVNTNGNLYPYDLAKDAVINFQDEKIKVSTAFMELDHPEWGKGLSGQPGNIAGMIVDTWWDDNDPLLLMGKAKLFDTDAGKTVRAIIDGGGRLGVSQRATGITEDTEDGTTIIHKVIAKYEIIAFDFVGHPATEGMRAGDTLLFEGRQQMKQYNDDEVKELLATKEKEVSDALKAEIETKVLEDSKKLADEMFAEKLEAAVAEKLEDAAKEKAKELFDAQLEEFKKSMKLEDGAADSLKEELAKKESSIKALEDKLSKMELDTFIDSELTGYEYRDKVLEIIGSVSSIEDAKTKIEGAKKLIDSLVSVSTEKKEEPIEDSKNMSTDKAFQRKIAGLD